MGCASGLEAVRRIARADRRGAVPLCVVAAWLAACSYELERIPSYVRDADADAARTPAADAAQTPADLPDAGQIETPPTEIPVERPEDAAPDAAAMDANDAGDAGDATPPPEGCDAGACDPLQTCQDTPAGHLCGPCPDGYREIAGRCEDVDECRQMPPPCEEPAVCQNLPSTFACTCPDGYLRDGESRCVDIDECQGEHGCSALAACVNEAGGHRCVCPAYYTSLSQGRECRDDHLQWTLGLPLADARMAPCGSGAVIVGMIGAREVVLGSTSLPPAARQDFFVARLDASRAVPWLRRFGGPGSDTVAAVEVDSACDVVLTGFTDGGIDLGAGVIDTGGASAQFLLKLSGSDGSPAWNHVIENRRPPWDSGALLGDVAVGPLDEILLVGSHDGASLAVAGATLPGAGAWDGFAAAFASDGELRWARPLGGEGVEFASAIGTDSAGNVLVAGHFDSVLVLGDALSSVGLYDVFVVKLDGSDGDALWARRAGGSGREFVTDIAVDEAGNVVVTGYFEGVFEAGAASFSSAGGWDGYVARWSDAGDAVWARSFGGPDVDIVWGAAVDAAGAIAVAGSFGGTVDLGDGPRASRGLTDAFLVRYTAPGDLIWAHSFGGPGSEHAGRLEFGDTGSLWIVGVNGDDADLGSGGVLTAGMYFMEVVP